MRLSEKTIELNFCAQFNEKTSKRLIWFGLTQKQEARLGFDAYTKMGGRLVVFQFKSSNKFFGSSKRFSAEHQQMENLINLCKGYNRSVFYVFPLVGTTFEIALNNDLISQSWLLDVADIPSAISTPLKRDGTPRKNGSHYVDVNPPSATIRSEPIGVRLISALNLALTNFNDTDGLAAMFGDDFEFFWRIRGLFLRNSLAAIVI